MRTNRVSFNPGWRFCAGNLAAAEQIEYDDSLWQDIDLPHDWSVRQTFEEKLTHGTEHAYLPNGIVWYRKKCEFEYAEAERIVLEFDGIYRAPDIFVNGKHLAKRLNGYMGFEVDITEALHEGENLIAVRVDNSIEATSRWYTGTGINRNTWLHRLRPLHFLRHGLNIEAKVDGALKLSAQTALPGRLTFQIYSPDDELVLELKSEDGYTASGKVEDPKLWSPEHPALYSCRVLLTDANGEIQDELIEKFGFRSVEFCPDRGFLLNGEKVLFRGVNLHEDLCGIGTAVYKDGIRRRYEKLKSWGVNAIRLAHHPYAPEWMELADEMGFLVFAEAYDKWTGQYYGNQVDFSTVWRTDLESFIKANRNHPSIFIWSVGNEVAEQQLFGNDGYGVKQLIKMQDLVHELDATRKVTCALFPARKGGIIYSHPDYSNTDIAEMAHKMDVVSVNYMGEFFAEDHKKYPEMIFIVSEEKTAQGAANWNIPDHEYSCGSFFWGGFDYLGESRWPYKNWHRGLMDRAGFRKPVTWQAEAIWGNTPVVRIAVNPDAGNEAVEWNAVQLDWEPLVSHWNWESGKKCRVVLFSNCERIELILNDCIIAEKELLPEDDSRIVIEVPYEAGEIKAIGYKDCQPVAEHKLVTAGRPDEIKLNILSSEPEPGGLLHVEIELVDENGIICPNDGQMIELDVSGAGYLVGVVNGDAQSNQLFRSSGIGLYEGRALAVIKVKNYGDITINAATEFDQSSISTAATVAVES